MEAKPSLHIVLDVTLPVTVKKHHFCKLKNMYYQKQHKYKENTIKPCENNQLQVLKDFTVHMQICGVFHDG